MDTDTKIRNIEQSVDKLKSTVMSLESSITNINRYISTVDKNIITDSIEDGIHDILWDKIFYVSSFASASITTTTTELLDANGRESDTSQGRKFTPYRQSRFKCSFYLNSNIAKGVFYITSPAVSKSASIGTAIVDADKSFVGIKIVGSVGGGAVNLVHSINGTETTKATSANIVDAKTNILEIDYYISHFTVFFNGVSIGDMPSTISTVSTFETFFPFLTSVGSTDGTSVNLTIEAFEFLQKRK